MEITSSIKSIFLTSAFIMGLAGCSDSVSDSSTSSNELADVTEQCTALNGTTLSNSCDFAVNHLNIREGVTLVGNNVLPGEVFNDLLPGEDLETLVYVLCQAPSPPNSSATSCN